MKQSAIQFFYSHAGYSYDPKVETKNQGRWRGARVLAEAERWAREHGVTYRWEWDPSPDLSFMSDEEQAQDHEVLGCVLDLPTERHAASLWGIVDPSREYRRVIEAELACEIRATILDETLAAL